MYRSESGNCPERLPLREEDLPERRRKSRLDSIRNLNSTWKICVCVVIFVAALLAVLVTALVLITKSVFNVVPVPEKFIYQECSVALEFCRNCIRNNESCMSRELDNDISNEVIFQSLDVLCVECHEQFGDCVKIRKKCDLLKNITNEGIVVPHHFCYTEDHCGPKTWGGICNSGQLQSPIILPYINTNNIQPSLSGIVVLRLNEDYKENHSEFLLKNYEHTIQVECTENVTSSAKISGDTLAGTYTFSQLRFHWGSRHGSGSEHRINGELYDLEIHLVHYSDHYDSFNSALLSSDRRALAVLGILVQVSANANQALDPILKAVELMKNASQNKKFFEYKTELGSGFSLFPLLPETLDFYRYQGSLTSPPCSEIVSWIVFRQPVAISEEQLNSLRAVKDSRHSSLSDNYRFPQPIGNREVLFQRFVP